MGFKATGGFRSPYTLNQAIRQSSFTPAAGANTSLAYTFGRTNPNSKASTVSYSGNLRKGGIVGNPLTGFHIEPKGFEGVISALRTAGSMFDMAAAHIPKEMAEGIAQRARQNLVMNGSVITGDLLKSIGVENAGNDSWRVYVGMYYAGYVEYGTSRQDPKPFFQPAIDEVTGGLLGSFFETDLSFAYRGHSGSDFMTGIE